MLAGENPDLTPGPFRPVDAVTLGVVALRTLPLLVRRRTPLTCLLLITAGDLTAVLLALEPLPADWAVAPAVYALMAYGRLAAPVRWATALAGIHVTFGLVALLEGGPVVSSRTVALYVFTLLFMLVAPGALGEVRRRLSVQAQVARDRADDAEDRLRFAERTAAEQRRELGRELHDAVGHLVTLVVLQADALRQEEPDPARAEWLARLGGTARQALSELRELIGVLDLEPGGERTPLPSLGDLGALLAPVRAAGLDVDCRVEGAPRRVPATIDLSACRVLQEAITNVLRHARVGAAALSVAYEPAALRLEVCDRGPGAGGMDPLARGAGLYGLRERVRLLGGDLEAGDLAAGGFRVRAWFPLERAA